MDKCFFYFGFFFSSLCFVLILLPHLLTRSHFVRLVSSSQTHIPASQMLGLKALLPYTAGLSFLIIYFKSKQIFTLTNLSYLVLILLLIFVVFYLINSHQFLIKMCADEFVTFFIVLVLAFKC